MVIFSNLKKFVQYFLFNTLTLALTLNYLILKCGLDLIIQFRLLYFKSFFCISHFVSVMLFDLVL